MRDFIRSLERKILAGQSINFAEAMQLTSLEEKADITQLYKSADNLREHFCGKEIDLCSIMNAKSGHCSEDCKFCTQSSYYETHTAIHQLVSKEAALKLARENEAEAVNRFSLVTSGRGTSGSDFEQILGIYTELKQNVNLNLCASLGILGYEQLLQLKSRGVSMYHHNLETSREYFEKICTTHSYNERIMTIHSAKKAGLTVCSGGIIGVGEGWADRVKLALELRDLEVKSIPVNVLNPIKGTPLENAESLSQDEILKTIAIFRMVNPDALIRLAGGRSLIDAFGRNCFHAGANAAITGNYLTTCGNKIADDKKMLKELNLEVRRN